MTAAKRQPKRLSKLRLFGLFFSLPLSALLMANAYSRLQDRKADEHRAALTQSLGSLCAAASLYAQENGNRLPSAQGWATVLTRETGPLPLRLPAAPGGKPTCIALNRALQGRSLSSIALPSRAILFFESTSGDAEACDPLDTLIPDDQARPLMFGFADGHIEEIAPITRRAETLTRSEAACRPVAALPSAVSAATLAVHPSVFASSPPVSPPPVKPSTANVPAAKR